MLCCAAVSLASCNLVPCGACKMTLQQLIAGLHSALAQCSSMLVHAGAFSPRHASEAEASLVIDVCRLAAGRAPPHLHLHSSAILVFLNPDPIHNIPPSKLIAPWFGRYVDLTVSSVSSLASLSNCQRQMLPKLRPSRM